MENNKVNKTDKPNRQKLMKLNTFLAKPSVIIILCSLMTITMLLIGNYLLNFCANLMQSFYDYEHAGDYIGLSNMFKFKSKFFIAYIVIFFFSLLMDAFLVYRIRVAYAEMDVGQKGSDKEVTLEDIKNQYHEVPMKDEFFDGKGGFIVSEYEDKTYIDDGPVNNLIIGTTRSGKGEMIIFPMIDIYSRVKNFADRPSLIVTDPKLELYLSSRNTLIDRGYEVKVLNFIKPQRSMFYNPLELIKQAYMAGEYSEAELLCNSFCYSVFNPDEQDGDSQFWANNSSNLLSALILATIIDCVKTKEYSKINMFSVISMFQRLAMEVSEDGSSSMLDTYFRNRPDDDMAKIKYISVGIAGERTKGSVFSNMLSKLIIFTYTEIAQMTSQSSINLRDIGFGDKPIAIFIGLPDYDHSKDFLASVFIRQIYFELAKEATFSRNGCCTRDVVFLLDEFGNLPPIENMASIITVCLSRHIYFNLFLQSLNQGKNQYKDAWDTIYENCGNKMYIMSGTESTAEEFSKLCGNKTGVNTHRSGKKLSLDKTLTEIPEEQRLITANELMRLKEGECVVARTTKRRDLKGEKIVPHPIFNLEKNGRAFRYRYQYMLDAFPSGKIMDDFDDLERTDSVDIQKCVYVPEILKMKENQNVHVLQYCYQLPGWKKIECKLQEFYDEKLIEHLAKNSIEEFQNFLKGDFLKSFPKDAEAISNYIKLLMRTAEGG